MVKMHARERAREKGENGAAAPSRGEIRRATLVGARVCPCIHPCTPGGGDRKVLISPPPSLLRRHPPCLPPCPGRLRPVAAPATFPRRHTVVGAATSPVSVSFSLFLPLSTTPISLEPPVVAALPTRAASRSSGIHSKTGYIIPDK